MICIKCGYEPQNSSDKFCENCGHEFNSNFCTNDHCRVHNSAKDPIPCSETACYCPDCGAETEYFKKELIVPKSYK